MVLCRKIARILKIDAPRLAAEVRKPARSECAEKSVSLKPELPDVRLHDQAHGLMVQPIRHHALILRVGYNRRALAQNAGNMMPAICRDRTLSSLSTSSA